MAEQPDRKVYLPVEAKDVIVTVRGRYRPWLSRVVGIMLAPFLSRRQRKEAGKISHGDRTA